MSYEESLECVTKEAGSDLSAGQYKCVNVSSDGQVDLVASKGAAIYGVLQDKPAAVGRACQVGINGVTKVLAGAVIAAGAEVICDATGRVITKDATDQHVLGTAEEAAVAAGNIIAVRIKSYQSSIVYTP